MWQGNAEILNRKPNKIHNNANSTSQTLSKKIELPKNNCTSKKSKAPTQLNKTLIPNKKTPVEMAPKEKYLIEASNDTILQYNIDARTYNVKLNPSIAKYTQKKL